VRLIEKWGSDEGIIEAARMSTAKGFEGWGHECRRCGGAGINTPSLAKCEPCGGKGIIPGDEKLLRFLWENKHATPFEMGGLTIEVMAPIFVFREWHRHRTQCLHPDTLIHFDAPKSRENRRYVYKLRVEELWRKWQPTVRSLRQERQKNAFWPRSRIQSMGIRALNEQAEEFGTTRIVDAIRGEPKPMVRITTSSGRSISLTRAHQVFTSIGWMALDEAIKRGAMLTLEGVTRNMAQRWEVPPISINEEWRSVVEWEGVYDVSSEGRVRRCGCEPKKITVGGNGYNVVSLSRGGQTTVRTVHSLVLEAFSGKRPPGTEARHRNNNRADARLVNLVWGTSEENSEDRVRSDRQQRLVPVFEEIVEVKEIGVIPTFDLAVEGPFHNFVADGFVVHNSYNEMSARYTPLPDVNYIPSVERLLINSKVNKQAGTIKGADELTVDGAAWFRARVADSYRHAEELYQEALQQGVQKELARIHLPVGRYSRMRASTDLRNWLGFLTLRMAPNAQWEIRQYANAVHEILKIKFPRTLALFDEGR
jgi:thymidylate synthase (FAD)